MSDLGSTPSQTVGPFLHIGLTRPELRYVVPEGTLGAVWLRGTVFDGAGEPVTDAMVETWQAGPDGRFAHPDDPRGSVVDWHGFGRSDTTDGGRYAIHTLVPGEVPGADCTIQAPHLAMSVFARGMLSRVVTRVYFPEHADANAVDRVLCAVPADRRHTLIAVREPDGYRFDVHLQGEHETVFFDI